MEIFSMVHMRASNSLSAATLVFFALSGCGTTPIAPNTGPRVGDAIHQLVDSNLPVRLAIVGDFDTSFSRVNVEASGLDFDKWRKGEAQEMISSIESLTLQNFGGRKNFAVVDRNSLNKIFDELALSARLEISDSTRADIGKLTGATHLLLLYKFRGPGAQNGPPRDTFSWRLVNVESGRVLASNTKPMQ